MNKTDGVRVFSSQSRARALSMHGIVHFVRGAFCVS
jgi:hypothetical protein